MSVGLLGVKLLAPFYGSSLYVWTAVLSITLLGLISGYYIGKTTCTKSCHRKTGSDDYKFGNCAGFLMLITAITVIRLAAMMDITSDVSVVTLLLLATLMFWIGRYYNR